MDKELKKIAFVITKSNWGGAQRYVYDLATSLPTDCFEVVVILGGDGLLKTKLQDANIRTISLPSLQRDVSLKKELRSFKELFLILKKEKPDVVHLNSSKAGGLGALIARLLRIKRIIFTAHAWAFNENRNWFSKKIITIAHWLTLLLSHHTITVSEYIQEQVAHFPNVKDKMTTVHLGLIPPPHLTRTEARAELQIDARPKTLILGTIAELHPVKGLIYGIDALSLLKDKKPKLFETIHYYIIGEGQERRRLEEHILKRKLENHITLLGFKEDASKYLKAFDLFLLPSLSEAFGYVLLEAGLAQVPVLASDVGGIPEIIEHDVSGILVKPQNAKSIKEALEHLLQSKMRRNELAKALYEKVTHTFKKEEIVKKTIDLYGFNNV